MMAKARMKIVLAYSGGLDTSVCVPWLKEKKGAEIIAYSAELGQGLDRAALRKKARASGASKVIIDDLREEFLADYVFPALRAGAVYEGSYLLATALGRPLIASKLAAVARREGAGAVAHGCTGKGNDQVRFEVTVGALAPELEIIAPVREWELKSREQEMQYAHEHGIPVTATRKNPYSIDRNLWGISIECGPLEDPWREPPEEIYQLTRSPADAPARAERLTVAFEKGIPRALNGRKLSPVKLVETLNRTAGRHGVGRVDIVENRRVGIKSREIYEFPAATVLHQAHRALENLVLDRDVLQFKSGLSQRYSELIYDGLWFSPLRSALDKFVNETQREVTGEVRVRLYKGRSDVVGRRSPNSLYRTELATYDEGDMFDHQAARGFIQLWGLPLKIQGKKKRNSKRCLNKL